MCLLQADPIPAPRAEEAEPAIGVEYEQQGDIEGSAHVLYGGKEIYKGDVAFG